MRRIFTLILICLLNISIHAEEKYWINQSRDNLSNLIFKSEKTGWLISTGDKGVELLKSNDGGASWDVQHVFKSDNCNMLLFIDTLIGFISVQEGNDTSSIYRTTDGGDTWILNLGKSYSKYSGMFFYDSNVGWLSYNGLYITTDSGKNWRNIHDSTLEFSNIQFTDLMTGWAVDNSQLIKTTDGGKNWVKLNITGSQFSFINNKVGFLNTDSLFKTNDGGYTWKIITNNNSFKYKYFTDSLHGYAFDYYNSFIYSTYDAGKNWHPIDLYYCLKVFSILDINHLWIISEKNKILRTIDAGKSWDYVKLGIYSEGIGDLQTKDGKLVIAVGSNGNIGRSTNGGDMWYFRNDLTKDDLKKVQMFDSVIYVLGSSGILLKSEDTGKKWNVVKVPETIIDSNYFYGNKADCYFVDKNYGWIAGKDGIIIKTTNGGKKWIQTKVDCEYINCVFFLNRNEGFIDGYVNADNEYGPPYRWGKLYKTTDGGNSWIDQHFGADGLKLVFIDKLYGFLLSSGGTMFKTTDAGLTWDWLNTPRGLNEYDSFFVLNKDYIWLNSFDGQYRTTNGGKDWQNLFDLSYATFILDTCTGWFGLDKTNNRGFRILDIPLLSSPPNNSKITKTEIDLVSISWQTSTFSSYELASDSLFMKIIKNETLNGYGNAVCKAINLKYYQKYYWRVRLFDEPVNVSEWSEIWSFIPVLDSLGVVNLNMPENNKTDIIIKPELTWSNVAYADTYRIAISTDSLFKNIIIDTYLNSQSFIPSSNLMENQKYFWHVKAINQYDSTNWSETWNFTTKKISSVDNTMLINLYEITPNPATDFIYLPETNELILEAAIYSIFGEKVLQFNDFQSNTIDISGLSKGVYFLRINNKSYKFVKI